MREFQINCVKKIPRYYRNENIKYVGNIAGKWRRGRDDIIARIRSKQESYYVINPETKKRSYLGVVDELGGTPYLQTHSGGKWNDDLLYLEECPDDCIVLL